MSTRSIAPLALLALVGAADASELRYSKTTAGQVIAIGNTLGLSKEFNLNGPGVEDSIGTFISLDPTSVDNSPLNSGNPWPTGTTNDWMANGSEAVLDLPTEGEVLYAELVWGGSMLDGSEDVRASLDSAVTLASGGGSASVTPDPTTSLTISETAFSGFPANYYLRSADVTAFVQAAGAGTYSVSGVPATQSQGFNSLNAAGWTLLVAYRDSEEPIHNLTIFVGGSFVDEDSEEMYGVAGFCTPPSGPFSGRAVITAIEGDADLTGDVLEVGQVSTGPFVGLSGPNNPSDNFFCSQLNDSAGNLDTRGSFGAVNHDAFAGVNVSGGRQGWDITSVPISSGGGHLTNGQTEAVLRAVTTGDSFVPTAAGFAIQVNAADFTSQDNAAVATPLVLEVGDTSTVTVTLSNDGLVDATDVLFTAPLSSGLSLVDFAVDGSAGDISGASVSAADLTGGVDLGDIAGGADRVVTFTVEATAAPTGGQGWEIRPAWTYDYISCTGKAALTEVRNASPVDLGFEEPITNDSGDSGDTGPIDTGPTDADSGLADSGLGDESECGCQTSAPGVAWLALPLLLAVRRRRD